MNPHELTPYLQRHRWFAVASSFGLALLYAEEGWATAQFWSNRPGGDARNIVILLTLVTLVGYLISFLIPPRLVNPSWKYARAWGIFSRVTSISLAVTVFTNVIAFVLLIYLVDGNLYATFNLLRDIYVYTLFGLIIFHGLLLYVRYIQYLYNAFGAPPPQKVISTSAGVAVLILLMVGFLYVGDLRHLESVAIADQGLVGVHTYARALYLFTLMLAAYGWHFKWIADH